MELKPDRFGQVHPIESPKLIAAKLAEFDEELDRLPADQKTYYMLACERSPELVSSKDKLMFLRCKVFDVKVSLLAAASSAVAVTALPIRAIYLRTSVDEASMAHKDTSIFGDIRSHEGQRLLCGTIVSDAPRPFDVASRVIMQT